MNSIINKSVAQSLNSIIINQNAISNNFNQIGNIFKDSHLNKFRGIDLALKGLTNSYIKDFSNNNQWNEIEIIEEANENIAKLSGNFKEEYLELDTYIEKLREVLISDLTELLSKSKSDKVRSFLIELITLIGFLLTVYIMNGKNSEDVIIETNIELEKIREELTNTINIKFDQFYKQRISTTDVNLRYSTNNKSKILGIVNRGQKITVIEIRKKWLLISFIDKITEEPKSGYVYKKYFKQIN